MKRQLKYFLLMALWVVVPAILSNCNPAKIVSQSKPIEKSTDEDFVVFYDAFHNDTLFQVSRYKFPMGGMSLDGALETRWTKDNLPLIRTRIYDVDTTEYNVTYKKTKKSFTQKVWVEDSEFISEFRFELIKSKWYLVYVLDQNF
ncbi:MAG: hypothetical protein WCX31_18025 [Salinivirgaceae bacterium]